MTSNFQMVRTFKDFKPEHFGILNSSEVTRIQNHFQLKERSNVELQNLRDFIILFYSREKTSMEEMDIMSGIVGVIDQEKFDRGMEV